MNMNPRFYHFECVSGEVIVIRASSLASATSKLPHSIFWKNYWTSKP